MVRLLLQVFVGNCKRSLHQCNQNLSRYTRESLRSRLQKPAPKTGEQVQVPYAADTVPVRPRSDLWKALGFTVGITATSFTVAAIWDFERNKARLLDIFESANNFFVGMGTHERDVKMRSLTPGEKCALALIASNCVVTALWRVPSIQGFMWRYFSNSFASRSLCVPMLTSVFSHSSLIHLGLNMYVLYTFTKVTIDKFLGPDHFWAFYLTAGVLSSFTSLAHKAAIRSPIRALGASGAILGLLTYTCCKIPDARLAIVFIPHFDFSAQSAVIGLVAFDLLGMMLGWRLFDHAAHLGGSIFGILYAMYGEKIVWGEYRKRVVKYYNDLTGGGRH